MREIVLQLKATQTWVSEITSKHPSKIRILDCKPSVTKDGIRQLVEVTSDPNQLLQIVDEIKTSPLVKEAYVVETRRGKVLGSLLTKSAFCSTIMSSEAFCRTCLFHSKAKPDGTVEWTLAFTGREALNELLDHLKGKQIEVKILRLSSVADVENLTEHQKSLVETALEEGFFDYPRRITLRELAKKMGVSPSSASEVLRRAEKKILAGYQRREAAQRPSDTDEDSPQNRILKGRRS